MREKESMVRLVVRCGLMLLALSLLCILPACRHTTGDGEDTTAGTEPVTDVQVPETTSETQPPVEPETRPSAGETSAPETEPETEPEETEELLFAVTGYPRSQAGAASATVLSVADFGAVGDGVTDDGPAVSEAVRAAAEQKATLRFEAGKVYYIGSASNAAGVFKGPLAMSGASGVTLDGQGATFRMAPGLSFFALTGCRDIEIKNCIFDMAVSVYLVGEVVVVSGNTVTFTTDREPYRDHYDFTAVNGFSIRYNEGIQNRPHMFMGQMTRVGEKKVTVEYRSAHHYAVGDQVFLPNPGVGHGYSEVIYIGGCDGALSFENIIIRQAPSFIMAIKSNVAEIYFENVDMLPDEGDGRAIHMVSWRDGYHCKDNRLPIHWHECDVGVLFDDVFNISNTLGYITDVTDGSMFTVTNYELYTAGQRIAFDCRAGDIVDVYDLQAGNYCGSATVRQATVNPDGTTTLLLEYGETLKNVKEGYVVGNRMTGAPGSTITDCRFTGTYRFLRDLRVENCTFDTLAMWIMVEGSVEGPMPGNLDFINCTFRSGSIQIDAYNRGLSRYLRKIGSAITDIGFWGCSFTEGCQITSTLKCDYTVADTYTASDLFTVRNARPTTVTPVVIAPAQTDFTRGVTYDWTYHTMPIEGAVARVVAYLEDTTAREALLNGDDFLGRVLVMKGKTLALNGLSASALDDFHRKDAIYTLSVTLYATENTTCALWSTTSALTESLSVPAGMTTTLTFTYFADPSVTGLSLIFDGTGTVYVGTLRVSAASNRNPSNDQLLDGHTFLWTDEVTIGDHGVAMKISDIPDDTVRTAVRNATSGFTAGTVLHLTEGFGGFSGLSDKIYYIAGKTYHLSLDAYIAAAMVPKDGTKIYLLAMDATPDNRVLAEGLFTGEGFYHFEMDWTVGSTGETSLSFYISNQPAAYPDVYIGDFTVTAARSYKPTFFEKRTDFHTLTREELTAGYTFDFTEGNLMNTGCDTYALMTAMDPVIAEKLSSCGFGDIIYYANGNFHFHSLNDLIRGGKQYVITLQVYDVFGNLATSGERGAIVLLNMTDGKQNSAEVHYTVEADPNDSRLLTLTLVTAPPAGTNDLYFYQLNPIEFIVGSVTVQEK